MTKTSEQIVTHIVNFYTYIKLSIAKIRRKPRSQQLFFYTYVKSGIVKTLASCDFITALLLYLCKIRYN